MNSCIYAERITEYTPGHVSAGMFNWITKATALEKNAGDFPEKYLYEFLWKF